MIPYLCRMKKSFNFIGLALRGLAMGIAEVIPGVSGGTIAFITGIYEQLINTIKAISPKLLTTFKEDGVAGVWEEINGTFLASLLVGMATGIVFGVLVVSYLLESYPPVIWGFFFGLIIASAIYIGRQIGTWTIKETLGLVIGIVVAYVITTIAPAEGSESLVAVFFAGAIAISALILPGISGSFILLLMGMYSYIITDTLKGVLKTFAFDKIVTMTVFALGCLTGLMTISRLLSWTFKHYKNTTLAVLTGFIIGSLNKIWPWRIPTDWLRDSTGQIIMEDGFPKKVITESNVLPNAYEMTTGEPSFAIIAIVCVAIGFVSVFIMERLGQQNKMA